MKYFFLVWQLLNLYFDIQFIIQRQLKTKWFNYQDILAWSIFILIYANYMNAIVHKIPDLCPASEWRAYSWARLEAQGRCDSGGGAQLQLHQTTGRLMVGAMMALWGPIWKFECFTMYALVLAFCKSKYPLKFNSVGVWKYFCRGVQAVTDEIIRIVYTKSVNMRRICIF